MRLLYFLTFLICVFLSCTRSEVISDNNIIDTDIHNFWFAYDKIKTTTDTIQQLEYLNSLFLDKGTPGLKAIMEARRYKPKEYIAAINNYPKYWDSVRANTLTSSKYAEKIQKGIDAFKEIYPDLKPAKVYFEIGVFRTPGTTMDSMVLIGAEMAMANENTDVSELPESMDYVKNYVKQNPIEDLAFLNVHEFVHTQQNSLWAYDLLSQSIFEGSAEFIAELASKKPSIQKAISYGKSNDKSVRQAFEKEMFSPWYYHWIWNSTENEFKTRDLGYYVGYAIVSEHYNNASDKKKAIKEIIELDYKNPDAIEAFAESTGYFTKPIVDLKEEFEAKRPRITKLDEIEMNSKTVDPDLSQFTIHFSEPMDTRFRSTDFGTMGKDHYPKIDSIVFAEDALSAQYHIKLEADKAYEMKVDMGYRNSRAIPLIPFLIKFSTKK